MTFPVFSPSPSSITTRFIVTFSLLFVGIFSITTIIFLYGFPGSGFVGWAGDEKNHAIRTLNILADMQKSRLLHMLDELRNDARMLAQDRYMKEILATFLAKTPLPADAIPPVPFEDPHSQGKYLEDLLQEFKIKSPFYQSIHVIRLDTKHALISTNPHRLNQLTSNEEFIDRIMIIQQDYIGGFVSETVPSTFFVGCPIFLASNQPVALVFMEVSLDRFLQPIKDLPEGPWRSAEEILVNDRGVDLLNPHGRHHHKNPFFLDSSDGITKLPSKIAASGQEGFIETQDVNNVSVLAGYRHIRLFPEWSWGLVIQISKEDLQQPMATAVGFAWLIGFLSTGVFVTVAFVLTRRLTRPLRQLTTAAYQLQAGHRHVRSGHRSKDEVGVLAQAFDAMADEVAQTLDNLERTVAHRTIALEQELEIRSQQQQSQQIVEVSLKESEQRYHSLVDAMTAGVAVYEAVDHGRNFMIRDINRMGEQLTHLKKDAIVGKWITDVFPGVVRYGLFEVLQRVYKTAEAANHPVALYTDQHLARWFENRIYKLPSGEIVAIFDDISERKLAEDALKMVLFSINTTHDPFLWFAMEGRIIRTNQATSTLLGYAQETLLSLSARDIFVGMLHDDWVLLRDKIRQTGTLVTTSHWHRQEGSTFPVEISASYLPGDNSKNDIIFASVRDISERIRSENEKRTLEQMAFHRERLATIGTLAAGVAHEINNPNNAIHFNAVMLQDIWPDLEVVLRRAMDEEGDFLLAGLPASEGVQTIPRLLEGVRNSSMRIQEIIGSLKHLSRQDQGTILKPIDLKVVLREAIGILQGQISRYTDHFYIEYLEHSATVLGNSQQLEQVFINLILNGLQSLPQRNRTVGVSMSLGDDHHEIQVIIHDEGIGIPEENLPKLTTPFFTTKGEQEGTGLGLSIAHSIIEHHGGRIHIASKEQSGTSVTVTLPIVIP
ncbi:MAG: PAS domain S-box protein [Nitrospirae bacterium]|nr:PAS domain S-box protein [Magnetococcales bacterium]